MRKRVALGAAVKAIRELRRLAPPEGMTADQFKGSRFAIECLMSHSQLSNIEAGRRFPDIETLYRIAALLRVPVDAISYETEADMEAIA